MAPDPIGREGGPNLYAYVLNNPVTHFDLYGLFAESLFTDIANEIIAFMVDPVAKTGQYLEFFTFHFLPIPVVRDSLLWTAHCMQGNDPFSYEWEHSRQHAYCHHHQGINGPAPDGALIVSINGICTSEDDMKERCREISELHGGVDVYGIYNPSHGAVLDLCEVALQKIGISTNAQRSAQKELEKLIDKNYHPELGLAITAHAHSQGCETVHNLSRNVKMMMEAYAYGPAHILNPREFRFAENYLSPIDLIPYIADPLGLIRGLCNGSVTFVKPEGNLLLNHCFDELPYKKTLKAIGDEFCERHGYKL